MEEILKFQLRKQDKMASPSAMWWIIDSLHQSSEIKNGKNRKNFESYRIYVGHHLIKLKRAINDHCHAETANVVKIKLSLLDNRLMNCRSIWGMEDCAKKLNQIIDRFFMHNLERD